MLFTDAILRLKDGDLICVVDFGQASTRMCLLRMFPSENRFQVERISVGDVSPSVNNEITKNALWDMLTKLEDDISVHIKYIVFLTGCILVNHAVFAVNKLFQSDQEIKSDQELQSGRIRGRMIKNMFRNILFEHGDKYPNDRIINIFINKFLIDNSFTHSNPIGLVASSVKIEANIISIKKDSSLEKAVREFSEYGCDVIDCVPSVLGSAAIISNPQIKTLVIHCGANETSFAITQHGYISFLGSIAIGGANITSEIAKKFKLSFELAEKVKIIYGIAVRSCMSYEDMKEEVRMESDAEQLYYLQRHTFTKGDIVSITEGILGVIMEKIKHEVQSSKATSMCGITEVVLTGGVANTNKLEELCKSVFNVHARVGDITKTDVKYTFEDSNEKLRYIHMLGVGEYLLQKRLQYGFCATGSRGFGLYAKLSCFFDGLF